MKSPGKYILAIDQSTSATKAILFDRAGKQAGRTSLAHQQYYPAPGFVEHDPAEIFDNALAVMNKLLSVHQTSANELAAVAITNQRETALIWDRETGMPVARAAVWQCQRGVDYCRALEKKGYAGMIQEKTGLRMDPYYSASKLHRIMNEHPELQKITGDGKLLLGTIDTWLLWKLTGGRVHATDYSNACRTMLFNIHSLEWDEELIGLFGFNRNMFPEVRFSDEVFGFTDPGIIFDVPVPISGIIGDSHAALFGQNCFSPGMGKATYGTGSSIMMHIGDKPLDPPEGLVTSIGYGIGGKISYVFEGNIHCTGDTINWLKNELQLIESADETEALAAGVEDNNGVYFVPAFVGLGAPYWDNRARASISGMPRNTTRAHVVRAALESIAYQVKDLVILMEQQGVVSLQEMRVDGGPTGNSFLMQFQADMLGRPVIRSAVEEVSALGAAFMAGLATGFWKDLDEIASLRGTARTFQASKDRKEVTRLYEGWKKAVERTRL